MFFDWKNATEVKMDYVSMEARTPTGKITAF